MESFFLSLGKRVKTPLCPEGRWFQALLLEINCQSDAFTVWPSLRAVSSVVTSTFRQDRGMQAKNRTTTVLEPRASQCWCAANNSTKNSTTRCRVAGRMVLQTLWNIHYESSSTDILSNCFGQAMEVRSQASCISKCDSDSLAATL